MKKVLTLALGLTLGTACGSSGEDYINLDGVFDAFVLTVKSMEATMPPPPMPEPAPVDESSEGSADGGEAAAPVVVEPVVDPNVKPEPQREAEFLKAFASNLNKSSEAIGYGKPLGVGFEKDGSFLGFEDTNKNNVKDTGEKDVFKLEIDMEKERLVATDLQHEGYHRDHTYRRSGMGFFGGYMVGRMLGGQTAAGLSPSRFSSMSMKPSGYHKSISGAKSYSSSARSSGGSRGYRGGK